MLRGAARDAPDASCRMRATGIDGRPRWPQAARKSSPENPIAFYAQTFRGAAWAGSQDGRRHSPLRPPASATPTVGRVPESGCEGRAAWKQAVSLDHPDPATTAHL